MINFKITARKTKKNSITLEEMKAQLQDLRKDLTDVTARELEKFAKNYLLERIKLNTPILTGKLRESGKVTVNKTQTRVHLNISFGTPYALLVHELERPLGPISAKQPAQPEGGVGHKYIERVVDYHADIVAALLKQIPEIALVQKKTRGGSTKTIREI